MVRKTTAKIAEPIEEMSQVHGFEHGPRYKSETNNIVKEYRNHSYGAKTVSETRHVGAEVDGVRSNSKPQTRDTKDFVRGSEKKTNRFYSYPESSNRFDEGRKDDNMSIFSNTPAKAVNLFKHTALVKSKLKVIAGHKIFSESLEDKHFVFFNTKDKLRVVIELYLEGESVKSNLCIYDNSERVFFDKVQIPQPNDYHWEGIYSSISKAMSMVSLSKQSISEIRKITKEIPGIKEIGVDIDGVDLSFGDDLDVLIDFNFRDTYVVYEVEVGRGVGEEFDSFSFYYNRDPKIAIYKAIERAKKFVSRMFHKMKQVPTLDFNDPQQLDPQQTQEENQSITELLEQNTI